MARRLPQPPSVEGGSWPRRWIAYERYRIIHESNSRALIAEGVVARDDTHFVESRESGVLESVFLRGAFATTSGGVLHVEKRLAVRTRYGRPHVLTALYIYHAQVVRNGRLLDIFRYDNTHGGVETLHRHVYDAEGNVLGREPVPVDELPPLSRIVRDVEFYAHYLRGD